MPNFYSLTSGSRHHLAWYQTVSSVLCTRIILCYSKGSEPECRLQKQLPEKGREGVLNKHFARVVWYGCVVLHPENDKHFYIPSTHTYNPLLCKTFATLLYDLFHEKTLEKNFLWSNFRILCHLMKCFKAIYLIATSQPDPTPFHKWGSWIPHQEKRSIVLTQSPHRKKKLGRTSQKNSEVIQWVNYFRKAFWNLYLTVLTWLKTTLEGWMKREFTQGSTLIPVISSLSIFIKHEKKPKLELKLISSTLERRILVGLAAINLRIWVVEIPRHSNT